MPLKRIVLRLWLRYRMPVRLTQVTHQPQLPGILSGNLIAVKIHVIIGHAFQASSVAHYVAHHLIAHAESGILVAPPVSMPWNPPTEIPALSHNDFVAKSVIAVRITLINILPMGGIKKMY